MKKKVALLFWLTTLIILFTGCFGTVSPGQTGSLKVLVNLPEELLKPTYVSYDLVLKSIFVKISMGEVSQTKMVDPVTGFAQFDNLEQGTWNVEITAKDTSGYEVCTGSGGALISPQTATVANIALDLIPGDLTVKVTFPNDIGVSSGKVTLINLLNTTQNQVSNLIIGAINATGSGSFCNLKSTTWPIEVAAFNTNSVEVAAGNGLLDILPGRMNSYDIMVIPNTGSLEIKLSGEIMPSAPTGLTVSTSLSGITLSWNANPAGENVMGYLVYRSTDGSGQKSLISKSLITSTTYTDSTPINGHVYDYWIQAMNAKQYTSCLSEQKSFSLFRSMAGIALTFDDHNINEWHSIKDVLSKYNAKATFFVNYFDKTTADELVKLQELKQAGNEIACHGLNHLNAVSYVSTQTVQEYIQVEILPAIQLMTQKGFAPTSFAYPYGSGNALIDKELVNYFEIIRYTDYTKEGERIKDVNNVYYKYKPARLTRGMGIDIIYKHSVPELEEAIDRALFEDSVLVLYAHKPVYGTPVEYEVNVDFMEQVLAYAYKKNVKFSGISEIND